jgi:hypothetical protein
MSRSERSSVAPAASAVPDARWIVAPSASGSEYGRPTFQQVGAGIGGGDAIARLVSASG